MAKTLSEVLFAALLVGAVTPVSADEAPELLKVFADTSTVTDILADEDSVWVSSYGGIQYLDRKSGKWTHYTRHDGLASNQVSQLVRSGNDVIAFHSRVNCYSVLAMGRRQWTAVLLDKDLNFTMAGFGGGNALGPFVVRPEDIWCLYSELDGGFIAWPTLIEVRQYSRAEPKLLRTVELYRKKPSDKPLSAPCPAVRGLMAEGEEVWVAMSRKVLRIGADGKIQEFPLPAEAVVRYKNLQEIRDNSIHAASIDHNAVWVRLDQGLGRLDRQKGTWTLLLQEEAFQGGSSMVSSGKYLWFAKRLDLVRFAKSTGELITMEGSVEYPPHILYASETELWTPRGRFSFAAGKWENPLPTTPFRPMRTILAANQLLVLGGEKLFVCDLAADVSRYLDVCPMEALVSQGSVWLISQEHVYHFSIATGKLERRSNTPYGERICRGLRLLKSSGDKHWYYAHSEQRGGKDFYASHFLVFDTAEGKLDMVATVPEEYRRDNAHPSLVTDRHLYINTGKGTYRYDLQKGQWEEAPALLQVNNGYQSEIFYSPKGTWHLYRSELRLFEGDRYRKVYILGPYIRRECDISERIELSSRNHVLRFDGTHWLAAPRKREDGPPRYRLEKGVDAEGRATGFYALTEAGDLSIWRGTPKPEKNQAFEPVEVMGDGTLKLPW